MDARGTRQARSTATSTAASRSARTAPSSASISSSRSSAKRDRLRQASRPSFWSASGTNSRARSRALARSAPRGSRSSRLAPRRRAGRTPAPDDRRSRCAAGRGPRSTARRTARGVAPLHAAHEPTGPVRGRRTGQRVPPTAPCVQGPRDANDVTTTPSLRTYVGVSATTTSKALHAARTSASSFSRIARRFAAAAST